jgi:hypothetical protein
MADAAVARLVTEASLCCIVSGRYVPATSDRDRLDRNAMIVERTP